MHEIRARDDIRFTMRCEILRRRCRRENVEIIRAAFNAYARGDTSGVLTDVAPDVIIQRWAPLPDPAIYRGTEGLLRMIADWIEDFDEFETGVEEYIDANSDQVITRVRQKARGAASGVPIEAAGLSE